MPIAIISIGSNIEDRLKHMSMALVKVAFSGRLKALSDMYETPPVGYEYQPCFINGMIVLETDLPPNELMRNFLKIEDDLGRIRTIKNGPRTVDLDIIFYDNIELQSEELTIPHPRWKERDFVITPLVELCEKGVLGGDKFEFVREFLKGKSKKFKPFLKI